MKDVADRLALSPAYADASALVYQGDCREILAVLPSGIAAVTITDPPYNCGKNFGETTDERRPWDEWCAWWDGILDDLRRVTPEIALAILSQTAHRKYLRAGKYEPDWSCIWSKPLAMGICAAPFMPHWEAVDFWGNARRATHFLGGDVFTHNVMPRGDVNHPTPKPLGLMRMIVRQVTKPGDVVLDPFAGSGTTLLAAAMEGRRAIGIEVSPAFCAETARRLSGGPPSWRREVALDYPETREQPSLFREKT